MSPSAGAARAVADQAAAETLAQTSLARYAEYVLGADPNDRRRFDSLLIGWLLGSVDEETARRAVEFAAAGVNGAAS